MHQHAFEQELWQLCAPYAHMSSPLHTLCERVERFLLELFVFVEVPGVPAENDVIAYCTPSAWLASLLNLTFILVMRVLAGRWEQHDPTAISMVHGNAPSSPP